MTRRPHRSRRAVGLGLAVALMVLAPRGAPPHRLGRARAHDIRPARSRRCTPSWEPHARPDRRCRRSRSPCWAGATPSRSPRRSSWRRLLLVSYVAALAWMLALALVGADRDRRRARAQDRVPAVGAGDRPTSRAMLREFVDRIPYSASPDNWPTHVAGHPPGALLFYVGLVRIGLGGDLAAGLVVTALGATTTVAVAGDPAHAGRRGGGSPRRSVPGPRRRPRCSWRSRPTPAFAAVAAWGLAALAASAPRASVGRAGRRGRCWPGCCSAGCVMLSYGLPLRRPARDRRAAGRPLVVAAAGRRPSRRWPSCWPSSPAGFSWWEALPVLARPLLGRHRRSRGRRPTGCGATSPPCCFSAGPLLGAGLAAAGGAARPRADRVVALLVAGAFAAIVVADLSRMCKAEVERIWLPFVPWLLLSVALLPERLAAVGAGRPAGRGAARAGPAQHPLVRGQNARA